MSTSRGIDVSSYQGVQDWKALAKGGLTFAFAKASEGQHTHDPEFGTHIAGIIAAGLVPGAYHFGWPTQDPDAEAANYVTAVHGHRVSGFLHILDLERRTDGANYKGRTAKQIQAWAHAWVAAVQAAFPHDRVGVYTSASDITASHLPSNSAFLWYPAYPSGAMSYADAEKRTPPAPSGRHPLFWQFTSTPVDRSLAYLSPADLRTWAAGDAPKPTQPDPPKEPPVAAPVPVEVSTASALRIAQQTAGFAHPTLDVDPVTKRRTDLRQRLVNAERDAAASAKGITVLTATVAALTKAVGDLHPGIDTATLVAAVEKAIADAVVDVSVTVHDSTPTA